MYSALGHEVTGFSVGKGEHPELMPLAASAHLQVGGSILDKNHLRESIMAADPDLIIHMGAISTIQEARENPLVAVETNVTGTLNVLSVAQELKIERCTIVTSDKVYSSIGGDAAAFDEFAPRQGNEIYSASKAAADVLAEFFSRDLSFPGVTVVRGGNVIGFGDRKKHRLVPTILDSISTGREIQLRNPGHSRPWQYVLDTLAGYLLVSQVQNQSFEAWNVGPLNSGHLSVGDFTRLFLEAWGNPVPVEHVPASENVESREIPLDCAKFHRLFPGAQIYSQEEMISRASDLEQQAKLNPPMAANLAFNEIDEYLTASPYRETLIGD